MNIKVHSHVAALVCLATGGAFAAQTSDAYVKRGLVAHWDAIDNAGVGVHDSSAATWVDLTGNGFDWTLDTTKAVWGSDKLTFNATGDGLGKVPGTSTKSPSDFNSKITTIECIYKADDLRYANVFSPGYDGREAGITTIEKGYMAFWDNTKQNMWGVPMDTAVHTYSAIYNRPGSTKPTGLATVYFDGKPMTPTQSGNWLGQVTTVSLGARATTWTKPAKGYLQSIRIYSVKLTPEEVALNHAIDQVRYFGAAAKDVVPTGYAVDKDGNFVKKAKPAATSVFGDAKVWYKGASGGTVGTADTAGKDAWTDYGATKLKSLPTANVGGCDFDGGAYRWWGWRLKYGTDHVKLPYAGIDLGETPCLIFPGAGVVQTNGYVDVEIKGEKMNRPIIKRKVGAFKLNNLLSDWPAGAVCSNYTCVVRFKPGEPINPVPTGNNLMKILGLGGDWNSSDGGVSITAMVKDYLSDRYCIRYTVGDKFEYLNSMEFDKDRWVDLAVIVESPKLTLYMCCEDGPDGAVTNKLTQWSKTFAGSPRPAIAANKRTFTLGSAGGSATYDVFTNGVNGANLAMDFQGSVHQFAFWDRTLSWDEVREAMGRPALVNVGLQGNAGNGEFAAKATSVAAEGDWENLNPVLTAGNPSATITFRCSKQWSGLPQFLRVAPCDDSDAGSVDVTLNGEALGELEVKPGAVKHLYVTAGKIAEGANTLVLTRKAGTTIKIDAVTLNGSWQNGINVESGGIGYFSRITGPIDTYNLTPFCGDDKLHIRGNDKSHPYVYDFKIPDDLVGKCRGELRIRVQNTSGATRTIGVKMNGTDVGTLKLKGGQEGAVKIDRSLFKAGWNQAEVKPDNWMNMDCHQFKIFDESRGLSLFVR